MTDMICSSCGQTGIRWMGRLTNLTHTECPHCGGQNCQEAPADDEGDEEFMVAMDRAFLGDQT